MEIEIHPGEETRLLMPEHPAPSIALCMMVRDEEISLARCLASLGPIVHAIYITDTGSGDRTVSVARSFGADIRHFPWQNDFALARNQSITQVAQDWILCLDADDYFPPGESEKIPGILRRTQATALTLQYEVVAAHSPAPGLKLFRNHLGIAYEGIIHESIHRRLAAIPGATIEATSVRLCHSGYGECRLQKKAFRNLPLLLREWERLQCLDDLPQTLYVGKGLAQVYFQTGRELQGEQLLLTLLDRLKGRGIPLSSDWEIALLVSLLCHCHLTAQDQKALAICQDYEPVFSQHPLFWLYEGICRFRLGHYAAALDRFQQFESRWEQAPLNLSLPQSYLTHDLWDWQGQCHLHLGHFAQAVHCFSRCMNQCPQEPAYPQKWMLARTLLRN